MCCNEMGRSWGWESNAGVHVSKPEVHAYVCQNSRSVRFQWKMFSTVWPGRTPEVYKCVNKSTHTHTEVKLYVCTSWSVCRQQTQRMQTQTRTQSRISCDHPRLCIWKRSAAAQKKTRQKVQTNSPSSPIIVKFSITMLVRLTWRPPGRVGKLGFSPIVQSESCKFQTKSTITRPTFETKNKKSAPPF